MVKPCLAGQFQQLRDFHGPVGKPAVAVQIGGHDAPPPLFDMDFPKSIRQKPKKVQRLSLIHISGRARAVTQELPVMTIFLSDWMGVSPAAQTFTREEVMERAWFSFCERRTMGPFAVRSLPLKMCIRDRCRG